VVVYDAEKIRVLKNDRRGRVVKGIKDLFP
jgi:hypothetical protein